MSADNALHHAEGWGQSVSGICPGCGSSNTLFVAVGQHITCSWVKCPNPCLVADFLLGAGAVAARSDASEGSDDVR